MVVYTRNRMIDVLVCLCGRQSFYRQISPLNSLLCLLWIWQIQACRLSGRHWSFLAHLDSPEGLPARQAAFLSGLPSSDYLAASANTNAPELPPWPSPVTQCSCYTPCCPHWHHCFFAMYQPVLPRFYSGSEMREPSPICLSLSRSGPGSSHYVLSTICRFPP